jgi:hypothetical protein
MESAETPLEASFFYKCHKWYQTEDGIAVELQGVTILFHCHNSRDFDISKPLKLILEIPFVQPSQPPVE